MEQRRLVSEAIKNEETQYAQAVNRHAQLQLEQEAIMSKLSKVNVFFGWILNLHLSFLWNCSKNWMQRI